MLWMTLICFVAVSKGMISFTSMNCSYHSQKSFGVSCWTTLSVTSIDVSPFFLLILMSMVLKLSLLSSDFGGMQRGYHHYLYLSFSKSPFCPFHTNFWVHQMILSFFCLSPFLSVLSSTASHFSSCHQHIISCQGEISWVGRTKVWCLQLVRCLLYLDDFRSSKQRLKLQLRLRLRLKICHWYQQWYRVVRKTRRST